MRSRLWRRIAGRGLRFRIRESCTSGSCRRAWPGTRRRSGRARGSCSRRSAPWHHSRISSSVASLSGAEANPGDDDFAEAFVGNADDLHLADLGVRVEKLLDLAGIDVFAAANDHVARAAGDVEASVFAHHAQVAGVQPAVGLDHLRGSFGIAVIALHHRVAANADFALHRRAATGLARCRASMTLISVCGMARPTVLTRISIESPASLMVTTGEVSVWP